MRVILTLIAVALVALLTTALVVPYFIDWSAHRAEIAQRLEGFTGGRVMLSGPVTLRLLPTPYLDVGAGSAAGAGPDDPVLTFEGARLEISLVKLASGAFRFTDVQLERPVLTIGRAADGALRLPSAASNASHSVGFDRFSVRDGTIRVTARGGAPVRTIKGVELDGDAFSLAGPYHVSGRALGPRGPVVFHLTTERAGEAGAPVRLTVDAGSSWPALEFDGALVLGPRGPHAEGGVAVSGTALGLDGPLPWRVTGTLAADLDGAKLSHAEYRFGPEERALRGEGSIAFAYAGAAQLSIELKVKQANFDALLRRKGKEGVAPAQAVELLFAALAPALAGAGNTSLNARISVETAILGGDTLAAVTASLDAKPSAPVATRFDFGLPGKSRIRGSGEFETGSGIRFLGAVDFSTEDPSVLASWAGQGAPEFGAWASEGLPASSLAVSGDIEASSAGVSGKNLRIALGRSILTGALAIAPPGRAEPGLITADLSSNSLDIDTLPSIAEVRSLLRDFNVSLSLDAKAVNVAHFGDAGIADASLALKLTKTGPSIALEHLVISNLGGASVEASGAIGPDGATASGRLNAAKLTDFAALLSRLTPVPLSQTLVARAALLAPASIVFEAAGRPSAGGGLALMSLKTKGVLGTTDAAITFEPTSANSDAFSVVLESPDSRALLRQLGLAGAAAAGDAGPAHVDLRASGAWSPGFNVDAAATLAGAELSWRGRYAPIAEGDDARLFGSIKVEGKNLAPLASLLGLAPVAGSIGPLDASADVTLRGDSWSASRLAATIAGVKASGALAYEPRAERVETVATPDLARAEEVVNGPALETSSALAAITGELSFDRLRLADIAALAIGAPQPVRGGAVWSSTRFGPQTLTPPTTALRLNVGALSVGDGFAAQEFSANLRLDRGRLDLDDVAMRLAGGAVRGRATLRRSGETATLDGALTVEPLLVKRGAFSGRVGSRLEFASTGGSAAALIAGLAGSGTATLVGATLSHSDPTALDSVIAAAQSEDAQIDETNVAYRFTKALEKGAFTIPDGQAPIAMSAGIIKIGPIAGALRQGQATLTAGFDLASLALGAQLVLTQSATSLKFWSGPSPSATVTVRDVLGSPQRTVDVAGLSAGLATQAIARESDRIANLEADIRERAFFNRRLKGERFLDRRNAELEDWRAEQERIKSLAQRLAAQKAEERKQAAQKTDEEAAAAKAALEKDATERPATQRSTTESEFAPPARRPDYQSSPAENASQYPGGAPPGPREADGKAQPAGVPTPPPRPKPPAPAARSEQRIDPTSGGLY